MVSNTKVLNIILANQAGKVNKKIRDNVGFHPAIQDGFTTRKSNGVLNHINRLKRERSSP